MASVELGWQPFESLFDGSHPRIVAKVVKTFGGGRYGGSESLDDFRYGVGHCGEAESLDDFRYGVRHCGEAESLDDFRCGVGHCGGAESLDDFRYGGWSGCRG